MYALNYTRQVAETAMGSQRDTLVRDAEDDLSQQRLIIVQELERYIAEDHERSDQEFRD